MLIKKVRMLISEKDGSKTLNTEMNQALTLKALPSVNLHFPPDGLARMFLQLLHAMTD